MWSLELANTTSLKILQKYLKTISNIDKWVINYAILKGAERPHSILGTFITTKNHQISPHNLKTVKTYEK